MERSKTGNVAIRKIMKGPIMEVAKIGVKSANRRITYGQHNPAVYAAAIGCFVVVTFGFDLLVPKISSLPRVGIYVAGFILGMACYRLVMRLFGAAIRSTLD